MESIQQQISTLTRKVERVYQIVERLDRHVSERLDAPTVGGEETSIGHPLNREDLSPVDNILASSYRRYGYGEYFGSSNYHRESESVIAQQDVLIDSSGVEINHHQIKEQDLSPQVQIQRLTAQLTAAYNRIAALEEQLLAKRWK